MVIHLLPNTGVSMRRANNFCFPVPTARGANFQATSDVSRLLYDDRRQTECTGLIGEKMAWRMRADVVDCWQQQPWANANGTMMVGVALRLQADVLLHPHAVLYATCGHTNYRAPRPMPAHVLAPWDESAAPL